MDLNDVASIIVLIGAVVVAIKNIYLFFKKPVDSIHKAAQENEKQRIEAVVNKEMPKILEDNQKTILTSLEEIKQMTLQQEEKLKNIQKSMDLFNEAQLDTMRYNMNRLYYKYRPYKKILDADKKAFIKFYEDYHSMGGNTWIDALYLEVKDWEIIESDTELKN